MNTLYHSTCIFSKFLKNIFIHYFWMLIFLKTSVVLLKIYVYSRNLSRTSLLHIVLCVCRVYIYYIKLKADVGYIRYILIQ